MRCPMCREKTKIINSRAVDDFVVQRRHECIYCGYRFNTIERLVEEDKISPDNVVRRTYFRNEKYLKEPEKYLKVGEDFPLISIDGYLIYVGIDDDTAEYYFIVEDEDSSEYVYLNECFPGETLLEAYNHLLFRINKFNT